jgi:hypothetical protein
MTDQRTVGWCGRRSDSCKSIDVRRWHREGGLIAGRYYSYSWTRGGEPSGDINVRTEREAVVLIYRVRSRGTTEWKSIEQRVPLTWTTCHLGGRRPWFICSSYSTGQYCGRRIAVLTARANYSHVGAVTAWRMKASKSLRDFGASASHKKSGSG